MTIYRGVKYGTTVYPVTDFTANFNRNPIAEQGMGLGGEVTIFDGACIASGTIGAVYRSTFITPFVTSINQLLSGTLTSLPTLYTLIASDEFGGGSFADTFINSFELSAQVKDLPKVTMGWIAKGVATAGTVDAQYADYATDNIPTFWGSTLNHPSIKITGFTIKLEVPIDQDNYIIGSKTLDSLVQSGNGTVSGTLSLAPTATEWATLQTSMGTCGYIGDIELELKGQTSATSDCSATTVSTITIEKAVASDSTFSGQNRNKFTKTINWKAPVNTTTNTAIFT